jgi:hypothetical protein
MPRIYDMDNNPLDYCKDCWIDGIDNFKKEVEDNKAEFEDWEGNVNCPHPYYEDTKYTCELCNKSLTKEDE